MTEVFEVDVRAAAGAFRLDARFATPARRVALVGPSGAGKSTLLDVIAGLLAPEAGLVRVAGVTLHDSRAGLALPAAARGLGYVFQQPSLFPHCSVLANLRYGARHALQHLTSEAEIVALLGLEPLLHRSPGKLSGGEAKRVALARALLRGPRALLLDEPFAGLDAAHRDAFAPLLGQILARFATPVLLVSHDAAEVEALCEDVIRMEAGRVIAAPAAAPR
ncbi:MAG: ATP-binding cassette domain-containing protein [Hyphomonadaceae bacterium]|nr:ATP-binding cassette domain-containing protein [Hyphomonadaceae bacterium]